MIPFHYITNSWYVAGFSDEFKTNQLKGHKICEKAIVTQCANSANHFALSEPVAYSGAILQKLINEEGVIVKVIPDDALIAIGNAAGEIIAEQVANYPWSAKIFASMSKFRSEQIPYTDTTEGEFIRARKLPYSFPS